MKRVRLLAPIIVLAAALAVPATAAAGPLPTPLPTGTLQTLAAPIIQSAPSVITYGTSFSMTVVHVTPLVAVDLVGAATYPLWSGSTNASTIQVPAPSSSSVAPPGSYVLVAYESSLLGPVASNLWPVTLKAAPTATTPPPPPPPTGGGSGAGSQPPPPTGGGGPTPGTGQSGGGVPPPGSGGGTPRGGSPGTVGGRRTPGQGRLATPSLPGSSTLGPTQAQPSVAIRAIQNTHGSPVAVSILPLIGLAVVFVLMVLGLVKLSQE